MRQHCHFCKYEFKVRVKKGATHHTGNLIDLRYIKCDLCQVSQYFDENMKLIKIVYPLSEENFKYISMNLAANHTTLIFQEEGFIQFDGCWPETQPQDRLKLARRLSKLMVFA